MNSLDVSHPTHNFLFYTYVDVVGSKLDVWAAPLQCVYQRGRCIYQFTKKDMLGNIVWNICCPYKHCKNEKRYLIDDVLRSHLIKY
jgi:hypothetical protein